LDTGDSHTIRFAGFHRRLRLIIGNDSPSYAVTERDVGRPIARGHVASSFSGTPPALDGTRLGIRVPGKGTVVVDVWLRT
jgi:hypothetical protein